MNELQRAHRDYGAAFADVLTLAKQYGLDFPTVERSLHVLTLRPAASTHSDKPLIRGSLRVARFGILTKDDSEPDGVAHMHAALQRAAQAFQQVVDAVHKGGITAMA